MAVMNRREDDVDRHVARWAGQLEGMDPEVEGAITRMQAVLRRLNRLHQEAADGSGIAFEDYKTLHALMIQPYPTEATPAQLADTCHVTRAAMTSRIDRIADAGLVTRTVDPDDRRRVIVRPTPAGRHTWGAVRRRGDGPREVRAPGALADGEEAAQRPAAHGAALARGVRWRTSAGLSLIGLENEKWGTSARRGAPLLENLRWQPMAQGSTQAAGSSNHRSRSNSSPMPVASWSHASTSDRAANSRRACAR